MPKKLIDITFHIGMTVNADSEKEVEKIVKDLAKYLAIDYNVGEAYATDENGVQITKSIYVKSE